MTTASAATIMSSMPPDNDLLPRIKAKLPPEERRAQDADRLRTIRLRIAIGRELDDRGITTAIGIGETLGIPPAEATALLSRKRWREGDRVLLKV